MFSQLKARRPGAPQPGTTQDRPARPARFGVPARAVRPLGFAAVAAAAAIAVAVAVARCKPGVYTSNSSGGSQQDPVDHADLHPRRRHPHADAEHDGHADGQADRDHHPTMGATPTPVPTATSTAGMGTPTPVPTGAGPTHW